MLPFGQRMYECFLHGCSFVARVQIRSIVTSLLFWRTFVWSAGPSVFGELFLILHAGPMTPGMNLHMRDELLVPRHPCVEKTHLCSPSLLAASLSSNVSVEPQKKTDAILGESFLGCDHRLSKHGKVGRHVSTGSMLDSCFALRFGLCLTLLKQVECAHWIYWRLSEPLFFA